MDYMDDELLHYGTKRHSGRYPWGSGDDLNGMQKFLKQVDDLRAEGHGDTEIARKLDMTTTKLRNYITWAGNERRDIQTKQILKLHEAGFNNTAIGNKVGVSEATVRGTLLKQKNPVEVNTKLQFDNVTKAVKDSVEKTGYLDVSVGTERQMGVSREKFKAVYNKLVQDEGYHLHEVYVKRLSVPSTASAKSQYTTVKVLTKDPDPISTRNNQDKIRPLQSWSDDKGLTVHNMKPPLMMDLDRIKIRYHEDGGSDKDGLIELRKGADGLDLGRSKYAQVRIGAGDNLYLKGMAAYTDGPFPKGVDVIFNTNKSKDVPKEKVLKEMKANSDNPFGATIKPTGQRGHLNIVNEEGDWNEWSGKMSSQFLSKQPTSLIKERLDATHEALVKEFNEINSLNNPVVKKHLMEAFKEGLDAKAKHLKAQGLPRTKSHVLLPVPSLKPHEIYAPRYQDGERVVLVRHPHGGTFEIPDLVVNNKNKEARGIIGTDSPDAVGIHPNVAQKLSGADFDGDTALVIPNNRGQIKTTRSLKELENFDHLTTYKVPKDSPVNVHYKDKETGEIINSGKTISDKTKQREMGVVSNLITDMTIQGATQGELARAVRHSMVVIDAEKHNLDYKQSARDNGISALRKKYQTRTNPETGKTSRGATTLISRSKTKVDISNPNFKPEDLISPKGTATEHLYAQYINKVRDLKTVTTKAYDAIPRPGYSKEAAKIYAPEIKSLNEKLNVALLNAPRERQAQILANKLYYSGITPDMNKDDKKKLYSRSLQRARDTVGAKKSAIKIEDREWEAIQNRAISTTKLDQILRNADMDRVRDLATPKESKLSTVKATRAKTMLAKGYTYAEVAKALGVSTTELNYAISKGE